ncbi:uncharacterized protein LOC127256575 [Andrographis paniculata]|uniref:uncharacterized protein LOC127256575 n=1 Tax=Andrographis paniculata TaxID=175694 RepID=UPI0021E8245E|nr:uncharacterized protein LOC127256575 [Andrographis paniculata]
MPGIAHINSTPPPPPTAPTTTSGSNNDTDTCCKKTLAGNGNFNVSSAPSHGFWSNQRDDVSYNQLHKFWCDLTVQARRNLLRIDKQTLFEHARKNMYCSRCNGLLLEGFSQIVMYGKSLQLDAAGTPNSLDDATNENDGELSTGHQYDAPNPSVHPWGGLTTARDGTLTLLNCYLYSKSLKGLKNVFDSARTRERDREMLYPDACGGGGRGWISQGIVGYGRGHGTRETCALHTAKLSVETLVDFWSALGEETRQSLLRMKEDDFIDRLMYRFDSKRFCRDCRRNVIREFKELKELKRMRKETRCTDWFCVADTDFQYEVSDNSVKADWHQTFSDSFGAYHHFEWAIGTGEAKYDILGFENVGLTGSVEVNNLDLSDLDACYITLRAWKMDGRCNELCVKAHALRGQDCVHCKLIVGDGFVTIKRGESIKRFFEHAEEAEEEEDDDSMDKDGNELDGECSRPQKHAKSPELAREFLLDAATVIFKEQVEKAFREGTARQNAHSIFVCLALKLIEERLHIACKEIITLEKQMKLIEEEEKEKREEEARRERRRTKEKEKKLRKKERLKVIETQEMLYPESKSSPAIEDDIKESTYSINQGVNIVHSRDSVCGTAEAPCGSGSPDIHDGQSLTECIDSNMENLSEDIHDQDFSNNKDWSSSFLFDRFKYSRRKSTKFRNESAGDFMIRWSGRRKTSSVSSENDVIHRKPEPRCHTDGYESARSMDKQSRTNDAKANNTRIGSKLTEKIVNPRMSDRYNPHTCSSSYHREYRSRPESRVTRSVRDSTYVNKLETSPDEISKPYYCSNKHTQLEYSHVIKEQPKIKKVSSYPSNSKKVWEPLDVRKKCFESNLGPDVALGSAAKVEGSESDQQPESCSTSSDEVMDISVQTNEDDVRGVADSLAEGYRINKDALFAAAEKPQSYSKEAVTESGGLHSLTRSLLRNMESSLNSYSNSDNCSSCLSEGDSNMCSNSQNLESTSTSDSEEPTPNSGHREVARSLEAGIPASPRVVVSSGQGAESQSLTPPVADSLPKETALNCGNGRADVSRSGQAQCQLLPQMHNFPIFQAPPTVGYYHHQNPVSWPGAPTNGLMPFPHSSHYLYANNFGYGLNANAWLMQYGGLQHLPPPPTIGNGVPVPVFQPVLEQVNGIISNMKEPAAAAAAAGGGGHSVIIEKVGSAEGQVPKDAAATTAVVDGADKKVYGGNDGFSLFHFGGPVALTAADPDPNPNPKEGDGSSGEDGSTCPKPTAESYCHGDGDNLNPCSCSKEDHHHHHHHPIEEYSLFAATNGIKFSIF